MVDTFRIFALKRSVKDVRLNSPHSWRPTCPYCQWPLAIGGEVIPVFKNCTWVHLNCYHRDTKLKYEKYLDLMGSVLKGLEGHYD